MVASEDLKGSYWAKNMTKTVLFSQALEYAVESCGIFNMALELGPHPALKRPAMETLEGAGIKSLEYIGTFARGKDDVQAVSDCLGSAWSRLGTSAVEWDNVVKNYCGFQGPMPILRNLPLYP
jgi:acyl transferase domain-containing protein